MNRRIALTLLLLVATPMAQAQAVQSVLDIPTRPGVTQRLLLLEPPEPKAAALLFAGGHGGLQLSAAGAMQWGKGNFLRRTDSLRPTWQDSGRPPSMRPTSRP
jgi:hypothetical protein